MSGISSTLQCDPVEIPFPSYAGALLDIAGQIVCTEQWLQCLFMLVIFLGFLRLKRKLLVKRLVCLMTKHEYFCFFSPSTKVFNIQPAMTPRCHQFSFHSGRNDNDLARIPLISNRPCCSPPLRFGVWNARSLKTKVSSLRDLMLSCSLDLLSVTESWLTSNDSITIADLTNSLEDYAFHHLPSSTRRGGGLAVIARKGLHVSRNEGCIFSSFEHFDSTITSGNKVFRLLKVHLPPPSKKNGFTVERFFSEFSALSEELTVTFCQFLLCGDFNFYVDIDSNANAKQFSDLFLRLICHPLCELIGNTPWNWSQSCEKAVCAVKCALTSAAAVLAYLTLSFLWNCGLTPLHMVWVPLLYSFISMETAA
ncbi:unnamed protein product [Pocillopora meandrina]|uniref:Endonuclease/exonuclease/phosphatase domain-containing protein n=1 Tax=Pocillopora meandrina TaxID=46732 RepID=A0AAU9X840_9CNID|nr:unnamed protein product [Pocillopora meandrina]